MKKFVETHSAKRYNVFDFDWSIPNDPNYYKNMLLMIMSMDTEFDIYITASQKQTNMDETIRQNWETWRYICNLLKTSNRIKTVFMNQNPSSTKFLEKITYNIYIACLLKESLTLNNNQGHELAMFTHPALYLMNHSCDPNIIVHLENRKNMIWTVNQPIQAGGEIFYPFISFYSQMNEFKKYCVPCKNGPVNSIDGDRVLADAVVNTKKFFNCHDPAKLSDWLKYKDQCCDFINKNFTGYYERAKKRQLIATKKEELREILEDIGYPFPPVGRCVTAAIKDPKQLKEHLSKFEMCSMK